MPLECPAILSHSSSGWVKLTQRRSRALDKDLGGVVWVHPADTVRPTVTEFSCIVPIAQSRGWSRFSKIIQYWPFYKEHKLKTVAVKFKEGFEEVLCEGRTPYVAGVSGIS